ncbi:hypothetical protein BH23ACT12_BH23ACT12_01330 [soil metagenome]
MVGMAKKKVTITLDPGKAERARTLTGATSTSGVIDLALDRLIKSEALSRDIDAYRRIPSTQEEGRIAEQGDLSGLNDDTDWLSLYPDL